MTASIKTHVSGVFVAVLLLSHLSFAEKLEEVASAISSNGSSSTPIALGSGSNVVMPSLMRRAQLSTEAALAKVESLAGLTTTTNSSLEAAQHSTESTLSKLESLVGLTETTHSSRNCPEKDCGEHKEDHCDDNACKDCDACIAIHHAKELGVSDEHIKNYQDFEKKHGSHDLHEHYEKGMEDAGMNDDVDKHVEYQKGYHAGFEIGVEKAHRQIEMEEKAPHLIKHGGQDYMEDNEEMVDDGEEDEDENVSGTGTEEAQDENYNEATRELNDDGVNNSQEEETKEDDDFDHHLDGQIPDEAHQQAEESEDGFDDDDHTNEYDTHVADTPSTGKVDANGVCDGHCDGELDANGKCDGNCLDDDELSTQFSSLANQKRRSPPLHKGKIHQKRRYNHKGRKLHQNGKLQHQRRHFKINHGHRLNHGRFAHHKRNRAYYKHGHHHGRKSGHIHALRQHLKREHHEHQHPRTATIGKHAELLSMRRMLSDMSGGLLKRVQIRDRPSSLKETSATAALTDSSVNAVLANVLKTAVSVA